MYAEGMQLLPLIQKDRLYQVGYHAVQLNPNIEQANISSKQLPPKMYKQYTVINLHRKK